uniref:Putative ribonuclease H-like domain-containing protein n=1 Tax=Tanacetum cinerariifolium TaxID=118510 RepID=A0A6L2J5B7_TANCI|nr:putative ribonuclease H-like domain-containing protein [Tanacetum cinerariifolium]
MIDYASWELIENGATLPKTKVVEGVTTKVPITTAEEKAQRRFEVKARITLMMGITNEYQLKFNSIKYDKKLLEAIEKRFEMLDQTFDRLQNLVSQLELLEEKLSQEDVNQKLLRSLSPEWNTHVVVWRNKADLDTISMDDLHNNLKSDQAEEGPNYALMAFSSSSSDSEAEAVNTACYVQNRVLVVKPHNKTPYEIFHDRIPTLSFMRPFGCLVTILNTIEHLGKFDGKAHEGSGPDWLFDIDALTRTINYETIIAGTRSNGFVEKEDNVNNTNNVNIISSIVNTAETNRVNVVGKNISIKLQFDPNMSALEDVSTFDFSRDDEDDGSVGDMNNLDTTIQVSLIPTLRIHNDHPLDQVIRDLQSAIQTRKISKNLEEHGFVSTIQQRTNHKDLQNCLFACFLSQEEPKKAIGTKWVFKNKKDERGIVIRNKARLVAQGYTQEEWIYYDEVFALIARIKVIRLFLAYASFKDFVVYQMDVKSAFLYGKIEEEVYVCQPPGFEDLNFPDRVYKVEKAMYGLHQALRACTSMETQKPLLKDEDGKEVDAHMYRYQVNLKVSHLHDVKRILGQAKKRVRLMMEKLFGMKLELLMLFWSTAMAKTINGEAKLHAKVDGKKIIITESSVRRDLRLADEEGIGCLPNSTIFEQIALMGKPKTKDTQVPQPSGPIKSVIDEAVHKELGDRLVRAATTASSLEADQDNGNITKTQSKATPNEPSSQGTNSGGGPRRVKKVEKRNKSRTHGLKRLYKVGLSTRVESSGDKETLGEDASKQGRRIDAIDADEEITLVSVQDEVVSNDANKKMFDVDVLGALEALKTSKPKPKVKGIVFQEPGKSTTTTVSSQQSQDNGKGIIIEEPVKPKKKDQTRLDEEAAMKLQAEFDEKERLTKEKDEKVEEANIALIEE